MRFRSYLIATAFTSLLGTPAAAADYFSYGCTPPPDYTVTAAPSTLKGWFMRGDRPRIVYVERYDPRNPPAAPTPTYVNPQYAYLASTLCDFDYGAAQRSWYDGKLFYRPDGVRSNPDSFMIIERD